MAGRRKKKRTHNKLTAKNVAATSAPKSFIVKQGKTCSNVAALVQDMRKLFEPNTASRLKERRNAKLKDYVSIAGTLGVSHMLVFSQTEVFTNLRMLKFPKGPTLHFQVEAYTLVKDLKAAQKNPLAPGLEYSATPLLILNNFGGTDGTHNNKEMSLTTTFLQNLFPSIDVAHMKLADARRAVLFSLDKETGLIQMRHYLIRVKSVGVSKSIKRVIANKIDGLDQLEDISEFILQDATLSESEVEDGGANTVTLGQDYVGSGNKKSSQRSISLVEIGPRLSLKLVKITDELNGGKVLYHSFVKKDGTDNADVNEMADLDEDAAFDDSGPESDEETMSESEEELEEPLQKKQAKFAKEKPSKNKNK